MSTSLLLRWSLLVHIALPLKRVHAHLGHFDHRNMNRIKMSPYYGQPIHVYRFARSLLLSFDEHLWWIILNALPSPQRRLSLCEWPLEGSTPQKASCDNTCNILATILPVFSAIIPTAVQSPRVKISSMTDQSLAVSHLIAGNVVVASYTRCTHLIACLGHRLHRLTFSSE